MPNVPLPVNELLIELACFPNLGAVRKIISTKLWRDELARNAVTVYTTVNTAWWDRGEPVQIDYVQPEDPYNRWYYLHTYVRDLAAQDQRELLALLRQPASRPLLPLLHDRLTGIINILIDHGV